MYTISVARQSGVKENAQAINQLQAILVSTPQEVRQSLLKAKADQCVTAAHVFASSSKPASGDIDKDTSLACETLAHAHGRAQGTGSSTRTINDPVCTTST